jgi:SH3 domain protein
MLACLVMPLLLATAAIAEQRYVQPNVDVPLRRGQGSEYKILKLVKNGEQVELLKETESWARIQLKSGTKGWMPKRYLSVEPPPLKLVKLLREENATLVERDRKLAQELTELKELHSGTDSELSTCIAERDKLKAEFTLLREETSDVVAINTKMAATRKEMEAMQANMHAVQLQNNELKRKTAVTWFLAGGGVLFAGWIIGLVTCRAKRRRSSLL